MFIYLKTGQRDHLMFVTPGVDSDSSDFKNADGSNKNFTVRFVDGRAEVPSNLGQYLLDIEAASDKRTLLSPIVRPQTVIAETRVRDHRVLGAP